MSRRVGHELFPEAVVDDGVHHPEPAGVLDVLVDEDLVALHRGIGALALHPAQHLLELFAAAWASLQSFFDAVL